MSQHFNYGQPAYPFFKESLSYQEQLMQQISSCMEAFNLNDRRTIKSTVNTLLSMVTPKMIDKMFEQSINKLEGEWQKEYDSRMTEYNKQIAEANAPDVIPKPTGDPSANHFRKLFMACIALFERRKLLLKVSGDESI